MNELTTSFTPINQSRAAIDSASSRHRTQSRGVDDDAIYDLTEASLMGHTSSKRRRGGSMRPITTSIETTSQNHQTFDLSPPEPISSPNHIFNTKVTYLSTPPDSKKKKKKRKKRSERNDTKESPRLSQLVVTKFPSHSTKLITTQNTVKVAPYGGLADTTLEKLADFRFRGSQLLGPSESPTNKLQACIINRTFDTALEAHEVETHMPTSHQMPAPVSNNRLGHGPKIAEEWSEAPTSYQPIGWSYRLTDDLSRNCSTFRDVLADPETFRIDSNVGTLFDVRQDNSWEHPTTLPTIIERNSNKSQVVSDAEVASGDVPIILGKHDAVLRPYDTPNRFILDDQIIFNAHDSMAGNVGTLLIYSSNLPFVVDKTPTGIMNNSFIISSKMYEMSGIRYCAIVDFTYCSGIFYLY
jgi:hypothetical protein